MDDVAGGVSLPVDLQSTDVTWSIHVRSLATATMLNLVMADVRAIGVFVRGTVEL